MKENRLEERHKKTFDDLKHLNEAGQEFWYARQLSKALDYSEYRNFIPVIQKAIQACLNSDQPAENHFVEVHEMVPIGSGAVREMESYALSRYACYLIVQNADPAKAVIANGQTYFAMQTRRQELADDEAFKQLDEDQKRVFLRNELREHNKQLVATAQDAGVASNLDFAIFQNHGYMGLYGGLGAKEIHRKKGLKQSQKILDHMGSTELAANLFRATQTEEKLKRDNIKGKEKANKTHYEVGKKVRETIEDISGTLPEDLPTPDNSVKKLEKVIKKDQPQIEENE
ncbi:MAG: DNA damage-inducible protein D [Candidatus Marinimicrobia bacterium]|nr:DNA damage-inducible protein D [Candidatus Neomarinimicrobiota bacterium]